MGLLSLSVATMLETRAKISTVVDCVINGLELKYRRAEEIVVAAETVAGTAVVEAGHVVEDLEACQTTYVPETVWLICLVRLYFNFIISEKRV